MIIKFIANAKFTINLELTIKYQIFYTILEE
jgi:hypothetical protein